MNPSIRAPGSIDTYYLAGQALDGCFDLSLNSEGICLPLEACIAGTVVFQYKQDIAASTPSHSRSSLYGRVLCGQVSDLPLRQPLRSCPYSTNMMTAIGAPSPWRGSSLITRV